MDNKIKVHFQLNGEEVSVETKANRSLLDVLRDDFHLTGTKEGCSIGECGACTVIVDGKAVTSCLLLISSCEGSKITTIEGISKEGKLSPVQKALIRHQAIQCGFCTPGFVMSATALLNENPTPSYEEIKIALSGNLCRCTGYKQIIDAIYELAQEMKLTQDRVEKEEYIQANGGGRPLPYDPLSHPEMCVLSGGEEKKYE